MKQIRKCAFICSSIHTYTGLHSKSLFIILKESSILDNPWNNSKLFDCKKNNYIFKEGIMQWTITSIATNKYQEVIFVVMVKYFVAILLEIHILLYI